MRWLAALAVAVSLGGCGGSAAGPEDEADGQRDALRGTSVTSVEIRDDEAQVELQLEDETFARLSGRPLRLVRDGERWLVDEMPDASSSQPQSGTKRGTALDCRTGGLESYEKGRVPKFWDNESREDFMAFITRYCDRVAKEVDDLNLKSARPELERIATEVIRAMVRSGRIDLE